MNTHVRSVPYSAKIVVVLWIVCAAIRLTCPLEFYRSGVIYVIDRKAKVKSTVGVG